MSNIVQVQAVNGGIDATANTTDFVMTLGSPVSEGNIVEVRYVSMSKTTSTLTVTDNYGNAWNVTSAYQVSGGPFGAGLAWCVVAAGKGGANFAVTLGKGGTSCLVGGTVRELSGGTAIDGTVMTNKSASSAGNADVTMTLTTNAIDYVSAVVVGPPTATQTFGPKTGYTADVSANAAGNFQFATLHRAVTATGTSAPGFTMTATAAWVVVAVIYKYSGPYVSTLRASTTTAASIGRVVGAIRAAAIVAAASRVMRVAASRVAGITTAASIQRNTMKLVQASALATSASVSRLTTIVRSASMTLAASVTAMVGRFLTLTASIASAPSLQRSVRAMRSATIATGASLVRQVGKVQSAAIASQAEVARLVSIVRTASVGVLGVFAAFLLRVSGLRTLFISPENRVLGIAAEDRSIDINAEQRALLITPEQRSFDA